MTDNLYEKAAGTPAKHMELAEMLMNEAHTHATRNEGSFYYLHEHTAVRIGAIAALAQAHVAAARELREATQQ